MRKLTFIVFAAVFLFACSRTPEINTISGYAQGTTYSVKYWTPQEKTPDKHALTAAINHELARIDQLMSNYRKDSVIERFNQQKIANQRLTVGTEIMDLLTISAEVYEKSQQCYDPTIKPLFQIWGFSGDKLKIPTAQHIQNTLAHIGFNQITRYADSMSKHNPAVTVDLSAIGQGYAVTQIASLLEQHHISDYMVEIGGEMLVAGTKPKDEKWRIGVERPVPNSQTVSEVITVSGKRPIAVMTSGTYRHYFDDSGKQYSHILDPKSGKPVTHQSVAVTVLMDNATYADAWSTALLCLGSEAGLAVANQQKIAAVFYDLDAKQQLQRLPSQSAVAANTYWEIAP